MKKSLFLFFILSLFTTKAQTNFTYEIELEPLTINNLPGMHSFAYGKDGDKVVIFGGRLDGLHARQPFNSFPASQNNDQIIVIDLATQQFWSADLTSLSTSIQEQLQASNLTYHQDEETLIIIGGYAFSTSANDHITFPYLTAVNIPDLIDNIINNQAIAGNFKQIEDQRMAVTGSYLGKLDDTYYLVGGHRFDGRYNPMNHPTFTQTYTDEVRLFEIDYSGTNLSVANYSTWTDQVHLHRRDYNLLPQVFPNGDLGYTISSGVFQINADLPFLYPVDITAAGYTPQTNFNQYLSNYHSAFVSLYDADINESFNIFFGGMAQYYYQNGNMVQDDNVPFVNTISMTTRESDGSLHEYLMPIEMPNLEGASAAFVLNNAIPHYEHGLIQLDQITDDTSVIGYIIGGINSPDDNPFSVNNTGVTSASSSIYKVKLIKTDNTPIGIKEIVDNSTFAMQVSPNPASKHFTVNFQLDKLVGVDYFITDINGGILDSRELFVKQGDNEFKVNVEKHWDTPYVFVTIVFDNKYYVSEKVKLK